MSEHELSWAVATLLEAVRGVMVPTVDVDRALRILEERGITFAPRLRLLIAARQGLDRAWTHVLCWACWVERHGPSDPRPGLPLLRCCACGVAGAAIAFRCAPEELACKGQHERRTG
ncbi:MAG: hypothetical protein M9894_16270 [Planctomycetes bacterium]|nr:hypothetical protein [Planctomycetota bacterium]